MEFAFFFLYSGSEFGSDSRLMKIKQLLSWVGSQDIVDVLLLSVILVAVIIKTY